MVVSTSRSNMEATDSGFTRLIERGSASLARMSSLSAPIRIGFAKISSAWERIDSVRMMLHEGLQRDGFEVVVASNVRDALRLIATETFDVLLSDLHMPLAGHTGAGTPTHDQRMAAAGESDSRTDRHST